MRSEAFFFVFLFIILLLIFPVQGQEKTVRQAQSKTFTMYVQLIKPVDYLHLSAALKNRLMGFGFQHGMYRLSLVRMAAYKKKQKKKEFCCKLMPAAMLPYCQGKALTAIAVYPKDLSRTIRKKWSFSAKGKYLLQFFLDQKDVPAAKYPFVSIEKMGN